MRSPVFILAVLLFSLSMAHASRHRSAKDVDVPSNCTPQVNAKIGDLIAAKQQETVDNVMVCGITISSSRRQRGGEHGDHEIIPLKVILPDGSMKLIEVVTNDDLDGKITAPVSVTVFAYGQAFFSHTKQFAAGVHDVHCSTHRGADNGWVVVNGEKHPSSCAY